MILFYICKIIVSCMDETNVIIELNNIISKNILLILLLMNKIDFVKKCEATLFEMCNFIAIRNMQTRTD